MGGGTDELHLFTKSSKTGLGYSTDSAALLSGIRHVSSKIGSQLLLDSTTFNALLGRRFEMAFNECPGVSNVFPSAA